MDTLTKIKWLIVRQRVEFSLKAIEELERDGLLRTDVYEALLSADKINKVITSTSPRRSKREKLYVIKNRDFSGTLLYTKGKFAQDEFDQKEIYYFLISSKIDEND